FPDSRAPLVREPQGLLRIRRGESAQGLELVADGRDTSPIDQIGLEKMKPNIVFILMDNLGYGEPGVYGGGILRGRRPPASTGSPPRARGSSTSTSRRSAPRAARRS